MTGPSSKLVPLAKKTSAQAKRARLSNNPPAGRTAAPAWTNPWVWQDCPEESKQCLHLGWLRPNRNTLFGRRSANAHNSLPKSAVTWTWAYFKTFTAESPSATTTIKADKNHNTARTPPRNPARPTGIVWNRAIFPSRPRWRAQLYREWTEGWVRARRKQTWIWWTSSIGSCLGWSLDTDMSLYKV